MNNPTKEAPALFGAGFVLVPCCVPRPGGGCSARWHNRKGACRKPGKRPLIKGYPQLAQARGPRDGLAAFRQFTTANPAGVIRDGFVVVEADSPEADEELALLVRAAPVTPTREARPNRGRGYVFRLPTASEYSLTTGQGESRGIDVLVPGGIFILPPAVHMTGHMYAWVKQRSWSYPFENDKRVSFLQRYFDRAPIEAP